MPDDNDWQIMDVARHVYRYQKTHTYHYHKTLCSKTSTSLAPYGTTFWAMILAACGGGGGGGGGGPVTSGSSAPKMVQKSGVAYNRPLKHAIAWLDVNNNQKIDINEDFRIPGVTNARGEFGGAVPADLQNLPVMIDTTKTSYHGKLPDTLLAPAGSRVVSPITHGLVTGEITEDQLPDGFDPEADNPYDNDNPEKNALFKEVKAALPLISQNLVSQNLAKNKAAINKNAEKIKKLEEQLRKIIEALKKPEIAEPQKQP